MEIIQNQDEIPLSLEKKGNIEKLSEILKNKQIVRFAIINKDPNLLCEYAQVNNSNRPIKNIFDFNPRTSVNNDNFNAVMIIPTGIGAEIGGDSGDGSVAAKLIGNCVDTLITHPNVVNAADINEMTPNTLYVEGSVLNRFIMGDIGLQPVKSNRMLMLYDKNDKEVECLAINAASSARVTLGCDIDLLKIEIAPDYRSYYNDNGIAVGEIKHFERLLDVMNKYKDEYDSFVLHTKIDGDKETTINYFNSDKLSVNPWGGLESLATHSISNILDISVAHSPMLFDNNDIFQFMANNVVDPVKSPEVMSKTELFCVIKGMHKAPKIVKYSNDRGVFTNRDIHVLITPDRCISLPLLAALEQNIKVIAIEDKRNLMKNNLENIPWNKGQFFKAKNYFEACGILNAIKHGISVDSFKRPIDKTKIL
jgi:hypothetical protein